MALGDEVKTIYVAFKTDGAEEAKAQIDDLAARADELSHEDFTIKITADDKQALEQLAALRLEMRALRGDSSAGAGDFQRLADSFRGIGDSSENARVRLRAMRGEFDALRQSAKQAESDLRSTGATSDALSKFMYNSLFRSGEAGNYTTEDARLLERMTGTEASRLLMSAGGHGVGGNGFWRSLFGFEGRGGAGAGHGGIGGWGRFLSTSGGWGALIGRTPAAEGQAAAGGFLPFLASPEGAAAIAGAAFAVSPLIVTALGGLVGGAGAYGAFTIASAANTRMTALQAAVTAAQKTYTSSPTYANHQALIKAQTNAADYQKANADALGLYSAGQNVVSTATSTARDALTLGATGPHGGRIAGTSFMAGLEGITSQIPAFITSMGPQLGDMFRSSLPYVQGFVKVLEGFASRVIPAVTSALNHFKPYIPDMVHFFNGLSDAVSAVIRAIGWMAQDFAMLAQAVQRTVRDVKSGWDRFGHDMANWAQNVEDWINKAVTWFLGMPGRVLSGIGNFATNLYLEGTKDVKGFLNGLGSLATDLYKAGENAIQGFINGIGSMFGSVMSSAGHLVSSVLGVFGIHLKLGSPSRATFEMGAMAGEGFRLGLLSKLIGVSSAAHTLAYAAIPNHGAAYGYAAGGGGGGVVIQVAPGGSGLDQMFVTWLKRSIRTRGGNSGNVGF